MSVLFNEINKLAYQYVESVSAKFDKVCQPLLNLGIPYFGYYKFFSDGTYLGLDGQLNLNFRKIYTDTIKNQGIFFTAKLNETSSHKYQYVLIESDIGKFNPKKDPILHLLYDFDIWNVFCIYKKANDLSFVEAYDFASTRNDTLFTNFCLNNIPLLERFINYFNKNAADLIDTSDKKKLAYREQQFNFSNSSKEDLLTEKVKRYIEEISLQRMMIKGKNGEVKLSRREMECLQYLALGNSAKEIAKHLNISPRTVECYLRHTKEKTGYYSRSQLVTNFVKNNNLSF